VTCNVTNNTKNEPQLQQARSLIEAGRLAEALAICEGLVRKAGPSAHPHFMMALVHEARGDTTRAADHLRRAIYLDPDHKDALLRLARLLGGPGDSEEARSLHERAQRIDEDRTPG